MRPNGVLNVRGELGILLRGSYDKGCRLLGAWKGARSFTSYFCSFATSLTGCFLFAIPSNLKGSHRKHAFPVAPLNPKP